MEIVQDFISRVKKAGQVFLDSRVMQDSGHHLSEESEISAFAEKVSGIDKKIRDSSGGDYVEGAEVYARTDFHPHVFLDVDLKDANVTSTACVGFEKEHFGELHLTHLDLSIDYRNIINPDKLDDLSHLVRTLYDIEVDRILLEGDEEDDEEDEDSGVYIPNLKFGDIFRYGGHFGGGRDEVHFAPNEEAVYLSYLRHRISHRDIIKIPESPADFSNIFEIGYPLFGERGRVSEEAEMEFKDMLTTARDSFIDKYISHLVRTGAINDFFMNNSSYKVKGERTFDSKRHMYIEPTLNVIKRKSSSPRVDLSVSVGGTSYPRGWYIPIERSPLATNIECFNFAIDDAAEVFGVKKEEVVKV